MKKQEYQYSKRTQKDYSITFKLSVVKEIEQGIVSKTAAMYKYGIQNRGTVNEWCKKYGNFGDYTINKYSHMQSPEQKIQQLQQQLRLLENQNKFMQEQLLESEDKAAILDKLIDIAEKEYIIPIRKNSSPEQSESKSKKNNNQ